MTGVLYVSICPMFIASRALHINTSRFSTEQDVHLHPNQVRLTGSTTFLTNVQCVSVHIYAA